MKIDVDTDVKEERVGPTQFRSCGAYKMWLSLFTSALVVLFVSPNVRLTSAEQQQQLQNSTTLETCSNDSDVLFSILHTLQQTVLADGHPVPRTEATAPTQVQFQLNIWDIAIDSERASIDLDTFVDEKWNHPALDYSLMQPCSQNISVDHRLLDKMWRPDIVATNAEAAQPHRLPHPVQTGAIFINGDVWNTYRIKWLRIPCSRHTSLDRFPFDELNCTVHFETLKYKASEVQLAWWETAPVQQMNEEAFASLHDEFQFVKWTVQQATVAYPLGERAQLSVHFQFRRRLGWYLLHVFAPSLLLVVLSWLHFAFSPKLLVLRTLFAIFPLSMLLLSFNGMSTIRNLPRASLNAPCAIEWWLIVCCAFGVASVLELALVVCLAGRKGQPEGPPTAQADNGTVLGEEFELLQPYVPNAYRRPQVQQQQRRNFRRKKCQLAVWIDRLALLLFPLLFAGFCVLFWIHFWR